MGWHISTSTQLKTITPEYSCIYPTIFDISKYFYKKCENILIIKRFYLFLQKYNTDYYLPCFFIKSEDKPLMEIMRC